MSGLTELHLIPAVAGVLESIGYTAQDAAVREQSATAARGHNLAVAWPPAARYSVPALAGLVSAQKTGASRAILLAPPEALAEWAAAVLPLAHAAGLATLVAETPARATRRLREGKLDLLITTPTTALALQERSALKMESIGHVVLAWPEFFEAEDALTVLMQDLPAEAQRIVIMAVPSGAHPLVERYARRALVTGPLVLAQDAPSPARPAVRVVTTSWDQRAQALTGLLATEDPASVTVWCADGTGAAEARHALPLGDESVQIATSDPAKAALIVAWDLPAPERLNALRALGDLVLLAPAHAGSYLRLVTQRQSPVRVPGLLETVRHEAGRRRAVVAAELEQGELDGAVLALSPLFERYDPTAVAAALYQLWQQAASAPAPVAEETSIGVSTVARVWIGAGKKDGATAADIVAVLNREVGMPAAKIGRIEIREVFCLVEVPSADAEDIARKLTGKTVRRRKLVAKVDRAPAGPSRERAERR